MKAVSERARKDGSKETLIENGGRGRRRREKKDEKRRKRARTNVCRC